MADQMVALKADEMAVMLVYKWDTIWAAWMVLQWADLLVVQLVA